MDANRRYMLLDGFIAPRSGGRSVASVVENRLLGIAGNSLIMPVARGVHLDPRIKPSKPDEAFDLARYYAPATPIPPARISLPTRGVFAEAVMGACNACEHMDDTRFWRWEEHPLEELPALPSLESRRAELSATTGPSALPSPVVSIQNAPEAPDPTDLAALMNLLGQQSFRDITGLTANQQNAAAAYKQALETATEFGKEASKLTQQAAMLKSLDKAMASIDKAEADKKIKPEEAQKLRNSALEKVTGGTDGSLKASDVTERLNVIKKAVADGAIDEAAAKGFSQSVLRSYVDDVEKPPAERKAAADLIGEIARNPAARNTVTRVQTGAPEEGPTIVWTSGGTAPAHKTGVGGTGGATPSSGLSDSISKLIDWGFELGNAALASEDDKLGEALANAAIKIAKDEIDAATDAIPMARAFKVAARLSLAFAEGVGNMIEPERAEIQKIIDEAAAFRDDVSEEDVARMQRARSHLAIGWQRMPKILEAGLQAAVDEILDEATGLLAEAAGAVTSAMTNAIAEHLLKAAKVDRIFFHVGQEFGDSIPEARRELYKKLSIELIRTLISTTAGTKKQRAKLEALVPAADEDPTVAVLRGLVEIAIADAIHDVFPLADVFPAEETATFSSWTEYEAKRAAHQIIEELKGEGWTFSTHPGARGINVDETAKTIDLPAARAWEFENGPAAIEGGLGLLEHNLATDEAALATLYDGLDVGILIRGSGYQAQINTSPGRTWVSRLDDASVKSAEDAAEATQSFSAALASLRARYAGTSLEQLSKRALVPATFTPATLLPPTTQPPPGQAVA
jgi:hypothetical protein